MLFYSKKKGNMSTRVSLHNSLLKISFLRILIKPTFKTSCFRCVEQARPLVSYFPYNWLSPIMVLIY